MRFSSILVGSVVVSLAAAVVSNVVYSKPEQKIKPISKAEKLPAVPELPPVGHLGNVIKTSLDAEVLDTAIAAKMANVIEHNDRLHYWGQFLNNPNCHFEGWHLSIVNFEEIDGGERVIVHSTPILTGKSSMTAMGVFEETYELVDGVLTLVDSSARSEVGWIAD